MVSNILSVLLLVRVVLEHIGRDAIVNEVSLVAIPSKIGWISLFKSLLAPACLFNLR
jgi:hypothetical protein